MAVTLITNARIFDGASVISQSGHVLVEAGRIKKISLEEPLTPPVDATVVDATGCTLLPGLIDAHTHVFRDISMLETALQYGVTTVFDLHNEPHWFQEVHEITRSRNDISDVKSACLGATISNGWPEAIVRLTTNDPNVSGSEK